MHQRKKNQNKQNFKTIKKTTLQQINYTQQLHIPTFATMELRQAGRSIELKKSSSKKPASRKSRCISVKQAGQQAPLNIKQLLKQIKSMKLIRSKSKSPRLSKSKQKNKKSSNKITHLPTNSKSNSELNLTAKIERTLQKLKQSNYFRDQQDSEIPLISTSQAFTQQEKKKLQYIISGQNYDDINIRELRLFCKNKEPGIRMSLDYFRGNIYEIMARRIQRAWRRHRTHKLVERYVNILNIGMQEQHPSAHMSRNTSEASLKNRQSIMISSQQLYPQQMIQRKITYISNLEEEDEDREEIQNNQQQDSTLYHLKKQQLEKWSEIITMINSNRTQNPQETQKLLKKLMNKSQTNKRNLQINPSDQQQSNQEASQINNKYKAQVKQLSYGDEQNDPEMQLQKLRKNFRKQKSSVSEDSAKQIQEQFNSKKYIEYLDSDMYPIATHHRNSMTTIGKRKQQLLLEKLQSENPVRRLTRRSRALVLPQTFEVDEQVKSRLSYRSNSDVSSASSIDAQELKSSRKRFTNKNSKYLAAQIRKSTSEKNIKYSTYQNLLIKHRQNEDNHQQQAFIESTKPGQKQDTKEGQEADPDINQKQKQHRKDIKMLQLTQKPKWGVEETLQCIMRRQLDLDIDQDTLKLITTDSQPDELEKAYLQQEFKKQLEELHRIRQQDSDSQVENKKQAEVQPVLHRSNAQIQKVSIQDYDHNIESEEDYSEGETTEKGEAISEMISNTLMIQFLVEVAKYPETVLKSFKGIAMKKPKIKRAPNKNKKNGFLTNQAEIKSFVQDICCYVINQEPQVFKNLQKATGPSALEMLRYMHQSVENDIYIEEQQDDPSIMILPNWTFQTFWTRKSQTIKYERQGLQQEKQRQRCQYLKGLNKIFLRSCFDCLNECLDYERNYGPFGKPFPWKRSHYFDHVKSLEQTTKSVKNAQKRLFEVSSTYCGIIIQKQQIASLGGNEDYITQVQQDRLSRMLAQDLVEGEQRWIFYDDEETELLVQTSNTIFHELFQQAILELGLVGAIQFSY